MNRTHICYGLLLALLCGCLYATAETSPIETSASLHPASLRAAGYFPAYPLPEDTTDRGSLPAEKVYKNIQMLRGMNARDLTATMSFITGALGVRCGYCHVSGDYASDDKPQKKTARAMIAMTREINSGNFGGENAVTCYTCHRGSPTPIGIPLLSQDVSGRLDVAEASAIKRDSAATVDAVLDRYVQALGGREAMAKLTTRVVQIAQVQPDGTTSTVETFRKAPDLLRGTTVSSDARRGTSVEAYNGTIGWGVFGDRPPFTFESAELEQLLRDAEFFPAADLRRSFSSVALLGRERAGDRDLYIISASRGRTTDRLYFDAGTGLLVRRHVLFQTPLGPIPFSIDYSDYREADGVRVPYTMKWTTMRQNWTENVTQLRHNITVADSMFARPK